MQTDAEARRGRAYRILRLAALALWLLGTYALVDLLLIFPKHPGPGPAKDFPVQLSERPSLEEVADVLVEAKVISEREKWLRSMRLLHTEAYLRGGWVTLNRAWSPFSLMPRLLTNRGASSVSLIIPEGFTRFDVATRLERFGVVPKAAFLAATISAPLLSKLEIPAESAEGYLFPATYVLTQASQPEDVVVRMVRAFRNQTHETFARLAEQRASARLPLTDHEALILASIVEREAKHPEERPIIAGVFVNRLVDPTFRPHRLQADPTVAYGCLTASGAAPTCAVFDGRRITPAMVRDPLNPYNTYRIEGLPPGPISNPGRSALDAAVSPMSHDFFYFVATGKGRHSFSHSLEEHNARIHAPR